MSMETPERVTGDAPIQHAEAKALALLALIGILLVAFVVYVMAARGLFEKTQQLVLIAENAEGVTVGTDLSFSGFPIGRVSRIELGQQGNAEIHIDVPIKDAHWLRVSSVFTLERGPVGGAKLRAFTGMLDDAPLADGARRDVLIGDASAGIPRLVSTVNELAENLRRISAEDSALNASIENLRTITASMSGKQGALPGLMGEKGAKKLVDAVERANHLIGQADARLFGKDGLAVEAQGAVAEVRTLLTEARGSLQKADAALEQARIVATNARVATEDLDVLRAELDTTLRKVSGLVDEVNRKWPFARERELKLP